MFYTIRQQEIYFLVVLCSKSSIEQVVQLRCINKTEQIPRLVLNYSLQESIIVPKLIIKFINALLNINTLRLYKNQIFNLRINAQDCGCSIASTSNLGHGFYFTIQRLQDRVLTQVLYTTLFDRITFGTCSIFNTNPRFFCCHSISQIVSCTDRLNVISSRNDTTTDSIPITITKTIQSRGREINLTLCKTHRVFSCLVCAPEQS